MCTERHRAVFNIFRCNILFIGLANINRACVIFSQLVGGTNYEWIVILGGTNDIYNKKKSKKASEQEITQNIISMHEIARQHKSKSVAVTIPEVYCETLDTCQDAKQLRERVNGNIRSYAYQNHDRVVLVDLADMLQRSNVGRDMVGQFFEGGLHLKPRGYERMAIIIFEGLKRALS